LDRGSKDILSVAHTIAISHIFSDLNQVLTAEISLRSHGFQIIDAYVEYFLGGHV